MATSRRLRVLFVLDHASSLGGAERFGVGLASHLPRDRCEAWLCSTRHGDEAAIRLLADAGVPHVSLGRRSKWHVHRLVDLVRLVRRERFDVLHAHGFGSNVWGVLIGRSCRVPVVIAHEHNWSYTGDRLRIWLDRHLIGRFATRFIAVSEANRKCMIELEHVAPNKVLVMPTAYIPHPGSSSGDIRAELGIGADVPLIGVAAVLRKEKALEVMLEAYALVRDRVRGASLVIAGDGPCRSKLERQINRLRIGEHVHLLGQRRDVDAILREVDVGALSSDWEGMPLFVFECMAANTPLVATSVGGVPEIVVSGRTGILVPPRNPAALASALEAILTDRLLAERLAAAAACRVHEFRIEAVAVRFADLYEQLVAEGMAS
jgi:glycosyltransferase involved in cell wall biosynthesis